MADWFSDGEAAPYVAASDRGFQYGDGLFETVAIRDGEARLWHYHMDRLTKGCELLGLKMPAHDELLRGVMHAVQQSNSPAAYSVAKIIVSAGSGRRGLRFFMVLFLRMIGRPPVTSPDGEGASRCAAGTPWRDRSPPLHPTSER